MTQFEIFAAAILAGIIGTAHAAAGKHPEWQIWCVVALVLYLVALFWDRR